MSRISSRVDEFRESRKVQAITLFWNNGSEAEMRDVTGLEIFSRMLIATADYLDDEIGPVFGLM